MPSSPVVDLDDDLATDRTIVGAKAARLAVARRAGLPALPGVVIPVEASRDALRAGVQALEQGGSGRARLAMMSTDVGPEMLDALSSAMRELGPTVIVRSSSPMEGDTAWSGTFSSLEDIGPDDLRTAVRGVWASAFTVHAVERYEAIGFEPEEVELAVLVQPQIDPECGGSARLMPDGTVGVHAIRGKPRDLMQGWETGVRARVTDEGEIIEGDAVEVIGEAPLLAAAVLARDTQSRLGDDLIEWIWADGRIHLLQSTAAPLAAPRQTEEDLPELFRDPVIVEVARLVERFPGPLGEQLVLPWAFAWRSALPFVRSTEPSVDLSGDLARALEMARHLTKQAWQDRSDGGVDIVAILAELRGPDPASALERLLSTRRTDEGQVRALLEVLDAIATGLAADGRLRSPGRMWRANADALRAMIQDASHSDVQWVGPDRWEPFLHAAVRANGELTSGTPVVPGIAAGRVVVIRDPHSPPPLEDRDVLVADRPLPALAPTLWRAGALVTATGNPAAHLMEVANSLALPTVLAADLSSIGGLQSLAEGDWLAAVDGDTGMVAFLPTVPRR